MQGLPGRDGEMGNPGRKGSPGAPVRCVCVVSLPSCGLTTTVIIHMYKCTLISLVRALLLLYVYSYSYSHRVCKVFLVTLEEKVSLVTLDFLASM